MKYSLARMLFGMIPIATPAAAHHSLAAYEISSYRTIEGTVKEFLWSNPHTSLVLIADGAPGEIKEWTFEGGSPGRLGRGGFSENIIVPGDTIKVSYHRNRDDSIGGFFLAVPKSNGELYSLPRFNRLREE